MLRFKYKLENGYFPPHVKMILTNQYIQRCGLEKQFLYNRLKYNIHGRRYHNIDNAFIWDRTKEGHAFWSRHNRKCDRFIEHAFTRHKYKNLLIYEISS